MYVATGQCGPLAPPFSGFIILARLGGFDSPVSGGYVLLGNDDASHAIGSKHKECNVFISKCLEFTKKKIYICSPTRYTTFVMVEYLFTICLTARHVSDLQVHPQEHL